MHSTFVQSTAAMGAALLAASAAARQGADTTPPAPRPAERTPLAFSFQPAVWIPRLGGSSSLGGSNDDAINNLEDPFDLDSTEAVPNIEFSMHGGEQWQLDLSGFHFSTQAREVIGATAAFGGLVISPGDEVEAKLEITSFAAEIVMWRWQPIDLGVGPPRSRVKLRFAPTAGVRYFSIDERVAIAAGGRAGAEGEWLSPFLGFRMQTLFELPQSFPLGESIEIGGGGGIGPAFGDEGGFAAHVHAGILWNVTPNLGATFGYRLVHFDVENDDYQFDGGLQGLVFGISARF